MVDYVDNYIFKQFYVPLFKLYDWYILSIIQKFSETLVYSVKNIIPFIKEFEIFLSKIKFYVINEMVCFLNKLKMENNFFVKIIYFTIIYTDKLIFFLNKYIILPPFKPFIDFTIFFIKSLFYIISKIFYIIINFNIIKIDTTLFHNKISNCLFFYTSIDSIFVLLLLLTLLILFNSNNLINFFFNTILLLFVNTTILFFLNLNAFAGFLFLCEITTCFFIFTVFNKNFNNFFFSKNIFFYYNKFNIYFIFLILYIYIFKIKGIFFFKKNFFINDFNTINDFKGFLIIFYKNYLNLFLMFCIFITLYTYLFILFFFKNIKIGFFKKNNLSLFFKYLKKIEIKKKTFLKNFF